MAIFGINHIKRSYANGECNWVIETYHCTDANRTVYIHMGPSMDAPNVLMVACEDSGDGPRVGRVIAAYLDYDRSPDAGELIHYIMEIVRFAHDPGQREPVPSFTIQE